MTDQPFFRFSPRAYETGSFEASDEKCDLCGRPCVWQYDEGIYAATKQPDFVCARCLADDKLRAYFGAEDYLLHDISLEGVDEAIETELLQRTPGVASFNPFEWPVRDGMPLAFIGYGDDEAVLADPAARLAIAEAFEGEDSSSYALVFRTLDGGAYEVVADFD